MDDLIYVFGALMGFSPDEVDFGRRVVNELADAEEKTVEDTADYLMTLRPDGVTELEWMFVVTDVLTEAISLGFSVIDTSAGFTVVEDYADGFKVVSVPDDEVPPEL